jgi:hypothetical protein
VKRHSEWNDVRLVICNKWLVAQSAELCLFCRYFSKLYKGFSKGKQNIRLSCSFLSYRRSTRICTCRLCPKKGIQSPTQRKQVAEFKSCNNKKKKSVSRFRSLWYPDNGQRNGKGTAVSWKAEWVCDWKRRNLLYIGGKVDVIPSLVHVVSCCCCLVFLAYYISRETAEEEEEGWEVMSVEWSTVVYMQHMRIFNTFPRDSVRHKHAVF